MATWGQAFGKTLLQMAPDVQKKMQTNFEDRRNADVMREIARIALMTDPAQQQAEIQRMMTDPNTPREIMQYLPKVAEASSAGIRGQQASRALAKGVGFTGDTTGLDAQTILALQQNNFARDRALVAEKAGEITRAREEAAWNQRQEAQKWLNSEEGIRTRALATATSRDRNGSVFPAQGAIDAQILYTQKWHEAGYTGNPPFQEPHYFAPQSGARNDDRDVIFRNLFDVDGTILPERVRAAMSLYPQYRDQLRPLMPLSPLAAQTLAAAKAMNPTNPAQALQDAIRIGGSAENINAAIEALESIGGTVEPAQATGQGQPAEGAATPEMPMPKTSNQVRAQMREIGAQLLDLDTQKWRLEQELKNYEQYLTPNPQWNPNAPRVPFSGGSTVPRYIISRETPPDVKARIEILLNDIDALKREIGSLRSRHGMINESGTAISATEWAERVRKNPSSKRR